MIGNGKIPLIHCFKGKRLLCLILAGVTLLYISLNIFGNGDVHQLTSSNTEARPSWSSFILEQLENIYHYSMTYFYHPVNDCRHCLSVDYQEIIYPRNVCIGGIAPEVLLLFLSGIGDKETRDILRRTWLQPFINNTDTVRYVFLLGKSQLDSDEQRMLRIEGRQHQDILQNDYIDTRRNLTIKTVAGLRWAARNCPNIKFIMKVDSDTWLNIPKWRELMFGPQMSKLQNVSFGHCRRHPAVIRTPFQRDVVSWSAFPGLRVASFCTGAAYALPFKLVNDVANISYYVGYMPAEDQFVGRCLEMLHYKVYNPPGLNVVFMRDISAKIKRNPCILTQDLYTVHYIKPKDFFELQELESQCCSNS